MSHASMLKARRQHQKTKKLLDGAAKPPAATQIPPLVATPNSST